MAYGRKIGAMVKFVQHCNTMEDWDVQEVPVEEVHRLAALDVRILNLGRHLKNILVQFVQVSMHDTTQPARPTFKQPATAVLDVLFLGKIEGFGIPRGTFSICANFRYSGAH